MYVRNIICAFLILTLGGCATSYQSTGLTGGFSETRLAEDMFRVEFTGNGFTRGERASDFALLRASELTLDNGYRYFVIMDENHDVQRHTYTTSGTTSTSVNSYGNYTDVNVRQNEGTTQTFFKPGSTLTIALFAEKPQAVLSYSAEFVSNEIRTKYDLEAKR